MEPTRGAAADKGFRAYPTNRLLAIVPSRPSLEAALDELHAADAPEGSIEVFYGEEGLRIADLQGEHAGLLARLFRKVQSIGELAEYKARYEDALHAGQYVLAMDAEDDSQRRRACDILTGHDARFINYFSRLTVQRIAP
jgi:hypothetical protein